MSQFLKRPVTKDVSAKPPSLPLKLLQNPNNFFCNAPSSSPSLFLLLLCWHCCQLHLLLVLRRNPPSLIAAFCLSKFIRCKKGADNISKAAPEIQGSKSEAANLDPETLGLLTSQADGSLGPDLWKGQSRKTIVSSLQAIKEPINAPMRDLLVRALLTTASPPAKVDDKDDVDLFALRLQKLVSLGEFTKAVDLYKKHDDQTPFSSAAIESGIEALIGSGKMGLACLESKAAPIRTEGSTSAFFSDVDFFCKTLLSPVSGSDDELRLANATRVFQENYKLPSPTNFDELNKMGTLQVLSSVQNRQSYNLFAIRTKFSGPFW
jgi:hypothetical protein